MQPLQVSRTAAAADPALVWNTFVKVCCWGGLDYSPTQRIAHLAFIYDAEVQNGGHHQYFENQGMAYARETLLALDLLGSEAQHRILEDAIRKHEQINPEELRSDSLEDFVESAREGHFQVHDDSYDACKPELDAYLKAWLDSNLADFIEWTD